MNRDAVLIEDKRFDLNKFPKIVLKGAPDTYKLNAKVKFFFATIFLYLTTFLFVF